MFKQTLLTVLAIFSIQLTVFSKNIIYVKQGAQGIGSSWVNATGDLQSALSKAVFGTEIWIVQGTYVPTQCTSCTEQERSISFVIPNGVKVIGGFKGDENRYGQRDWRKHPTTFSGNIGQPGPFDNSYTVVYTRNSSKETVLDGIILADGFADAPAPAGHPSRSGAALYNDGSGIGNASTPTLVNCLFLHNYALEGGAVFNNGELGDASPVFTDCIFSGNKAHFGGGAVFNNGSSNPHINYTQFVSNQATFGAGVFFACSENDIEPNLSHCTFVNNKAERGGGLFFLGLSEGPQLRTSRFINNLSNDGEDIFVMKGKVVPGALMAGILLSDDGDF